MTNYNRGMDFPDANDEAQAIWERIAASWHAEVGDEGDDHHRYIVAPATKRLLDIRPDEVALDIACGSGIYSRLMAAAGAKVLGVDVTETFLNIAREINDRDGGDIEYRRTDATDYEQLIALGEETYDAINCTMGIMNFPSLTPLARAIPRLLKPNGRFVFAIPHPAFNRWTSRLAIERDQDGGGSRHTVAIHSYLDTSPQLGIGIPGQQEPKYDFDRPIGMLLNAFFEQNLFLDRFEEPAFSDEITGANPIAWTEFKHFPPHLIARMRRI